MWEEKMKEVYSTDAPDPNDKWKTNTVEDPMAAMDINRKQDKFMTHPNSIKKVVMTGICCHDNFQNTCQQCQP